MTWFDWSLFIVPAALSFVSGAFVLWRLRKRPPTFKQIGDALERDIAAAEARGVKVDRTERMAPRKRIRF